MNKKFTFENMPAEVYWAMFLRFGPPIGVKTYDKYKEVVAKYPKWFPWETKYDSIPKHIHDAYSIEMGFKEQNYYVPGGVNASHYLDDKYIPVGNGLEDQIMAATYVTTDEIKEASLEYLKDFFNDLENNQKKREAEERRSREIWNKYYSKYRLEYRG